MLIQNLNRVMRSAPKRATDSIVSKWFLLFLLVAIGGCGASKSREFRAIEEHQVEGRLVYREKDGVQYYVECENGLKYISSTIAEERIGPVAVCEGEEE